jgi:hypothetical protein
MVLVTHLGTNWSTESWILSEFAAAATTVDVSLLERGGKSADKSSWSLMSPALPAASRVSSEATELVALFKSKDCEGLNADLRRKL